jgi:hypothetical protein
MVLIQVKMGLIQVKMPLIQVEMALIKYSLKSAEIRIRNPVGNPGIKNLRLNILVQILELGIQRETNLF